MSVSVRHFQQLEKIQGWRQQAFILGLSERSLPNLLLAIEALEIESTISVPRTITALWTSQLEQTPIRFEKSVQSLVSLTETLALYSEYGARTAEDAAQLLLMVLEVWKQPELRLAREAGQLSFQTVTRHIEFSEGNGLTDHELVKLFDRHPLIKRELEFQRELQKLLGAPCQTADRIKNIRELARNEGVSNIGICLES
jgi:uncharacterized protein YjaG (DUF416 family)